MCTPARLALLLCLALTIVHTWPLAGSPASRSLNYNADAEQWEWTLSWIAHAIVRHPLGVFDGNVFAPERRVLTYSDPVIVPGVMGAPLRWLGASPVLTFNLVVLAGLTLTAWSGWFVVWRWTGSASAALVAGALAAFNAHLLTRLPHVPAAHSWGVPLTLYVAARLVDDPRRRDVWWLALIVAATAATSLYTLTFAALIVGVVMLTALPRWRSIGALAAGFGLGFVLALPVLWPYVELAMTGASRPLAMVAEFSARPAAYLTSLSRFHAGWTARFYQDDVNVLFAGVAALALGTIGVVTAVADPRHRRRLVTLILIAAAGVLLSFGPATGVYRWLYDWLPPLRGLRAVARFGYLYLIVVATAAGLGVAWLQRRTRSRRAAHAVALAALAAVTIEAWSGPIPTRPFARVPPIYDLLAESSDPVMLVEVPFFPTDAMHENGEYMLNATAHWRPVMNGYSGDTPDSYRRRAAAFWFFPRDFAIDAIVREGATHVMVHFERFTADERADIQASLERRPDLRLVASDAQGHRLLRVER